MAHIVVRVPPRTDLDTAVVELWQDADGDWVADMRIPPPGQNPPPPDPNAFLRQGMTQPA